MERLLRTVKNNYMFLLLVALVVMFSFVFPGRFLSPINVSAIFRQFLRLALFALGPTFVVIIGSIDLTYVGIWMLGGILVWYAAPVLGLWAISIYPLIGLVTGLLAGMINVKAKVPSFVLTLSITVSYWGLTAWLSGGYPRRVPGYEAIAAGLSQYITGELPRYFPSAVVWAIPIFLIAIIIMKRTKIGAYFYAIGSNEEGARMAGVNVEKYKILAFALSGLFTGLGLVILFPLMGSSAPVELKLGSIVDPLVAIVLGGTPLVGGSGGPEKTLLGALIYTVIHRALALTFWHPELVQLLLGLVVLWAILLGARRLRGVIVT
ncbi:MAG: ABC transporter permease [Thermosphaera sp.]